MSHGMIIEFALKVTIMLTVSGFGLHGRHLLQEAGFKVYSTATIIFPSRTFTG
jgi:hypothetical protein